MPLFSAFNDPRRMGLASLGIRMMQAAQPSMNPSTQGMGTALGNWMGDLQGIQRQAMLSQREKREQEKYEKEQEKQRKTQEALQKYRTKQAAAKAKGGGIGSPGIDYKGLASELMAVNPEMAIKIMRQAPQPLRGRHRYQVTNRGLLDMRGDKPRIVPGTENLRASQADPAEIQVTNAVFSRMKALEPNANENELWMRAFHETTKKASLTPEQAISKFYSSLLTSMVSDDNLPEEIQRREQIARQMTRRYQEQYFPNTIKQEGGKTYSKDANGYYAFLRDKFGKDPSIKDEDIRARVKEKFPDWQGAQ